jgi:hypothetical protein
MSRYEAILKNPQERANIKTQYNRVIDYYNSLGGTPLEPVEDKDPLLGLLLFGYSDAERKDKDGTLAKVKKMLKKEKIKFYNVGNTESVTENTLVALYPNTIQNKYLEYEANSGSVMVLTSLGRTVTSSVEKAYEEAKCINFTGISYRKDICKSITATI